jgi:hypothetical protein
MSPITGNDLDLEVLTAWSPLSSSADAIPKTKRTNNYFTVKNGSPEI